MQLPQRLARFNRHVTNPIQRMWAGWAPSFGILEHVGRRSGKAYRTPLTVFNAEVRATSADGNTFRPLWREQVTGKKPQVFRINRDSPALPFAFTSGCGP